MSNYLIMIDNDYGELAKLKHAIACEAEQKNIRIIDICTGEDETQYLEIVKTQIQDLVSSDESIQEAMRFHIVVDACLLRKEEELSSIKDIDNLSGIHCLYTISEFFKSTKCKITLSLMSRFFAQQLNNFKQLQEFSSNEKNHFWAVIKKPIMDDGEIDEGTSLATDYSTLLPLESLSRNHLTAFRNILFFKLIGA